ncbi:hypothetical protein [Amycolatopsis sp. Hca4]|uniref:hypothetical protein n=1 Tax=Amycolatopsis sp. Hca4 TaxID=2742131 RepID=UPI00158FE8A2|nr:hypothetical protein [Amycolatopsis sp. Hca4]QKV73810.1 hypothetical protein HUT10_08520 [Amycolatopsis sp. Hca4]
MTALDTVLAWITEDRLRAAAHAVTAIPSPTGREAPLARMLASRLAAAGFAAEAQHLDEFQANAVGRLRGAGDGEDLMLYAPIDTLTTGQSELDIPWIGPELRPDMLAEPRDEGPFVSGLGASNPKGHAACILVLAEALGTVRPELAGDVVVAFGAGGMPTNAIEAPGYPARANTGQGVGCSFLLERGWHTDHAVIAKPGDFVAHDEVGLCWFEITVPGIHTYAGSRHRLPYRNPIVTAADVVTRLERWLADYPARHRTATAAPQGIIGSIAGGWERMLAVTPAACRIRVDVRIARARHRCPSSGNWPRSSTRSTWSWRWCWPFPARPPRRTHRSCGPPSRRGKALPAVPTNPCRTTAAPRTRTSCVPAASRPSGPACRKRTPTTSAAA